MWGEVALLSFVSDSDSYCRKDETLKSGREERERGRIWSEKRVRGERGKETGEGREGRGREEVRVGNTHIHTHTHTHTHTQTTYIET